jgi:hypothetical protein
VHQRPSLLLCDLASYIVTLPKWATRPLFDSAFGKYDNPHIHNLSYVASRNPDGLGERL